MKIGCNSMVFLSSKEIQTNKNKNSKSTAKRCFENYENQHTFKII